MDNSPGTNTNGTGNNVINVACIIASIYGILLKQSTGNSKISLTDRFDCSLILLLWIQSFLTFKTFIKPVNVLRPTFYEEVALILPFLRIQEILFCHILFYSLFY